MSNWRLLLFQELLARILRGLQALKVLENALFIAFSCCLASSSAPARLRLVAAANVCFAIGSAVGRALGLVFLRQRLVAYLVVVIGNLASLRRLFITRILFGFHEGFLES